MALDTLDVAEETAAGFGLGVLYQAVEDRVPSAQTDLYTGGVALAGYAAGLLLLNRGRRRGGVGFAAGNGLVGGAAALAGAQATRYVDGKFLKLSVPAGFLGNAPRVVDHGAANGGAVGRPPSDF